MQSSGELEKLQSKIEKYEEELERLERTTDPENQTAMLTMLAMRQELAAIRQKEVLLMQGEQASCMDNPLAQFNSSV